MSRIAGPRAQRLGNSALIQGCGVQLAGLLIVGLAVAVGGMTPTMLAILLTIFGVGQAVVMAPLYGLVLRKVPAAHAGSGGGVVSTVPYSRSAMRPGSLRSGVSITPSKPPIRRAWQFWHR